MGMERNEIGFRSSCIGGLFGWMIIEGKKSSNDVLTTTTASFTIETTKAPIITTTGDTTSSSISTQVEPSAVVEHHPAAELSKDWRQQILEEPPEIELLLPYRSGPFSETPIH